MNFYVDAFSYCNLRCPSCPVGNWPKSERTHVKGLLNETRLSAILKKAIRECEVTSVGLFNWTEPLLNPNLPALIRLVKSYDQWCALSSNLNVLDDADALMSANPDWFRVSVSGFSQETYVRGHVGGDIEHVKDNMRRLSEARMRTGATTDMEVFFHRYVDNEADEAPMKALSESLGYRFATGWAYLMPVEKVLSTISAGEDVSSSTDEHVTERLALPVAESVEISASHNLTSCDLQTDFMALDVTGEVYLCCASSGRPGNKIGNYLDLPLAEIQARKRAHSLCGPCLSHGLPVLFNHADPRFDEIGRREQRRFAEARDPIVRSTI